MKFFRDSEGRLHLIRIAALPYVIILLMDCREFRVRELSCLTDLILTTGWWLSFCGKRPWRTLSDLTTHPIEIIGLILVLAGLVGKFYFVERR